MFYIVENSGFIYLRTSVIASGIDGYQLRVEAYDAGSPVLVSVLGFVNVFILRNQFAPNFDNTACSGVINQNVGVGTSVTSVRATDADNRVSCYPSQLEFVLMLCHTIRWNLFIVTNVNWTFVFIDCCS